MSITRYKSRRNFSYTPEPKARKKKRKTELHFVVQQHAARHLHYDFRLEMEGVLKSWAVPKGPSLNPDDKRLAMEVEDHPFDYKDFEGTIPEGNYGAGTVMVWDAGTYEPLNADEKKEDEKKLLEGWKKGHLSFVLHGKKLKGEFSLVKIKKDAQKNAWLLIKKKDKYSTSGDVLKKSKSVLSGKTMKELEKNTGSTIPVIAEKKLLPPTDYSPMLAETISKPFNDPNWVFEIKYDGYRAMAIIDQSQNVKLFSRNHISFNEKFKPVAEELKKIEHVAVLDGEIVIEDEHGRSNFQLLQNYQKTGEGHLKYYVFDLLNLDGRDITNLTLLQRKELAKTLLEKYRFSHVFFSEHISEKGKEFYELAVKNKLEGIMAKKSGSQYRLGRRSADWLKVKITNREVAVIAGITQPEGSRKYFGSLLLAQYDEGRLKYIGNCGTGFTEKNLKELYAEFEPYFTEKPTLEEKLPLKNIQWLEPKFVCSVKFTEKTLGGILRHPVFLGLRSDKEAEMVVAEKFQERIKHHALREKKLSQQESDYNLKVGKITIQLTNQNKVFFPENHITKGQVVNYYKEISSFILPYLKNRPQSLLRFPNGIDNMSFYQKHVEVKEIPPWLKTHKIYSESEEKSIDFLLCNDKATLLYMANLGCIDFNPWSSAIQKIDHPDWMILDLDPVETDFGAVVKTALAIKDVLDEMNLKAFCKTSGKRGLHVYVPMGGRYNYKTVKLFAELIAHTVNVRLPHITSTHRMPQKRQGKVYIDYLQNRRGQTVAAPYSVRPLNGAPVSTPLEWEELNEKLNPTHFNLKNMLNRLEKKGDLWKGVLRKEANIDKILKKMKEPPESST